MKTSKRILLLSIFPALLALTAAPTLGMASDDEDREDTELEEHMEEISDAWRKVRRGSKKAENNAANAKLVAGMIKHAKAGIDLIPLRVEDVPEAERDAFLVAFKKEMKVFIDTLVKLQKAFAEDRHEDAVELVAKISKHQRASHKEFKRPDDD